jgi:hypothetical protein
MTCPGCQGFLSTCWYFVCCLLQGPTAYPNNSAFVREHVTNLLATSFPNLTPQQV